ncbi:MAG: molybdate ABC transporter substrate-binding protein [Gemmatimonadota bacterium]
MRLRFGRWIAAGLLLGACSCGAGSERATLSVYAASSLTEAFTELAETFMGTHPGVRVEMTFSGSQVLRVQIEEGAPADVFASADAEHVEALIGEGLMDEARVFAYNELVIVVPPDNPADIESFEDLPRAERIVLGTPAVPVGRYARETLAAADSVIRPGFSADVLAHVVSEESNVRLARSKVELGEADAAVVYRTDAAASDRVRMIPIPASVNVRADYLMGEVRRPDEAGEVGAEPGSEAAPAQAGEWDALVRSAVGREVLERHGFVVP